MTVVFISLLDLEILLLRYSYFAALITSCEVPVNFNQTELCQLILLELPGQNVTNICTG